MQAKVIKAFRGARDGSRNVENFKPGAIVEGDLASVAIREGWAESTEDKSQRAARRWEGETVVIIASGPSLTKKQVEYCKGKARVIAINNNYQRAPWADVLYACESDWWDHYFEDTKDFQGEKWTMERPAADKYGINWINGVAGSGLSRDPNVIHTGGNSGYQAINLAYHFGAKRIILLGYDMQRTNSKKHWHPDHPGSLNRQGNYRNWSTRFVDLANDLAQEKVEVFNCTRKTALAAFKQRKLEDVL